MKRLIKIKIRLLRLIKIIKQDFGLQKNFFDPLTQFGSYAVNYPAHLSNSSFLGLSNDSLINIAILTTSNFSKKRFFKLVFKIQLVYYRDLKTLVLVYRLNWTTRVLISTLVHKKSNPKESFITCALEITIFQIVIKKVV